MFNNFFFFENRVLYEITWKKYCRTGQVIEDNKTHAHCMLSNQDYRYTVTR